MSYERQLIALLILKQDIIPLLKIKPKYLSDVKLQKILEMIIDSYSKYNYIKQDEYADKIDVDLYCEILVEELVSVSNWKQILEATQCDIVENYKKQESKKLLTKLEEKKINYETFGVEIDKLKLINANYNITYLTNEEIMSNITLKNKLIKINKYPALEKKMNLVENDLLIIGASTGGGKSAFLLNLMETLSDNYQCIYFNLEMSKTSMYRRLIGIASEQQIKDIDNPSTYQKSIFRNAVDILTSKKIIFEHQKFQISDITSIIAEAKDVNKHTIVFIDHIGLLRAKGFKSLYEQMTEISKQLRQISLNYDCTIICASQLNRGAIASDEINISMLKDSGEIENSARKILLLYPKDKEKKDDLRTIMNVEIAKNDSGSRGIIEMRYDKLCQTFKEV